MTPVLQTLSESEFRKDRDAVAALGGFLTSHHGQKFCAAMRGCDPLTLLASPENRKASNVRDLAIAETANPQNLLGVVKGFRLALQLMDDLCKADEPGKKPVISHQQRAVETLRAKT